MRRRITMTMVIVVAGALLVATLGTLVLLTVGARADTRRELGRQATSIAARLDDFQRPGVLNAFGAVLRLEDQRVVCLGQGCRITGQLPPGITLADLHAPRLRGGETITGNKDSLAFAAAGVPRGPQTLFVVVLTQRVHTRLPGGPWFVLVAAVTLAIAGAVAADLGRRLTRPLREAQSATRRIAGGDLAARVPVGSADGEELAELAASINAMAASLERSRGLERQFLLSVSHDLRTPLTSIRGFAEALAEGRAPDPGHAATVILAESRRLERLVQDLLELAKLDARRFSLDIRPTDVGEVVGDTAEGFRLAAEKAGVALRVDPDGTGGAGRPASAKTTAAADADRLAQVVANLVENALKYARSSIDVGASQAGGQVQVWVEDDGPGIPAEDLPHVFEPFYRSPRAASRDVGSGLGLAIVHELVEAMGGDVRAEAAGGGGARMVVTLPRWSAG